MTWKDKHQKLFDQKVLVVGAGGIGCELLKNLAATGFKKVHVVDLDTIDVSNLNRQFLFRKEHVKHSKAEIATQVVKKFCPDIDLTFDHQSIFEEKFSIDFIKSFDIVMNALDNRKARNHVNRMCHAARVPLIESGSAGFYGNVLPIVRDQTECYECTEKPITQRTFPGCTIRNTPSEHIHCTVWAKHVFNQLFGEIDIDDDVSPDMKADEPNGRESSEKDKENDTANEEPTPIGTRQWAESVGFEPSKVFNKLFNQDIEYLCKMEHLWKERKRPHPLTYESAINQDAPALSLKEALREDTSVWSLATCAQVFADTVKELTAQVQAKPDVLLSFEKDEPTIMAFVAAVANIRAGIFLIPTKSMFDIKAMAGNIVPAIAATNAMVAGVIVAEAVKVIYGKYNELHMKMIRQKANVRGQVFHEIPTKQPNPNCYVCSETKEVFIYLNPAEMTVNGLEKVLKNELNMLAPDVMDTGSSRVILSSDGDTDELLQKKLSEVSIENGAILSCDDFQQDLVLKMFIRTKNDFRGDQFEILRSDGAEEKKEESKEEKMEEKEEEDEKRKRKVAEPMDVEDGPDAKRTRVTEEVQVAAE